MGMSERAALRRLAAVLHADVVGFSRLMAQNESETVRVLNEYQAEIEALVAKHEGRLVDKAGDSLLAEFPTATGAVAAALDIQSAASAKNAKVEAGRRMQFRVGVHLGELRVEGERVYGDAVNIAARIQAMAESGGICLSSAVYEQVRSRLPLGCEDLGGKEIKNIPYPVQVYRVTRGVAEPRAESPQAAEQRRAAARARGEVARHSSIAVLPFDIFTPDPDGVAYGDILATEVIRALSRPHGLRVASRLATSGYRGRSVSPPTIGHELGVEYVLSGNVRRSGDRAKVMVEISDTTTGSQIWTRNWDVGLHELIEVPEGIAQAIVAVFEGAYVRAELKRARRVPDESQDARGLIQKARLWFLRYSKKGLLASLEATRRAIAIEPDYAVAHSTLALVAIQLHLNAWGGPPDELERQASQAANRAVELRPDHPICLENYGLVACHLGDHERGVRALRRAVEIAPTDLIAWSHLGFALGWDGETQADAEEADAILQRIYRTAPEHPLAGFWPFFRSSSLIRLGNLPEAIEACRRGAEAQPGFVFMWLALANALALDGQQPPAEDALARMKESNEEMTPARYAELIQRQSRGLAVAEINLEGLRRLGAL